jgi:hypothetical protein
MSRRLRALWVLLLAAPCGAAEIDALPPKALIHVLDHGLWHDRVRALYAVGNLGEDGLPLLRHASDDADWQVRLSVVHFLGKAGEASIPDLGRFAREEHCPHVRLSALRWLAYFGGPAQDEYESSITPEDSKLMGIIPERYGNAKMGKPQTVDPPEGFMTQSFFNGGVDLRVCASSEHTGWGGVGGDDPADPSPKRKRRGEGEAPAAVAVHAAPKAPATVPAPAPDDDYSGPKPPPPAPENERPPVEYLPPGYPPPWRGPAEKPAARPEAPPERVLDGAEISAALAKQNLPKGPAAPARRQAPPVSTELVSVDGPPALEPAAVKQALEKEALPPGPPAPARGETERSPARQEDAPARALKPAVVRAVPRSLGEKEAMPRGEAAPESSVLPVEAAAGLVADAGAPKAENDPLPVLLEQLRAKEGRQRARAADELGRRPKAGAPAVAALSAALADRDRRVRASAALALGNIARPDEKLRRALRRLLKDADADVRFSAHMALQRLSSRP